MALSAGWDAVRCSPPEGFAGPDVQAVSLMWLAVGYLSTGSFVGTVAWSFYGWLLHLGELRLVRIYTWRPTSPRTGIPRGPGRLRMAFSDLAIEVTIVVLSWSKQSQAHPDLVGEDTSPLNRSSGKEFVAIEKSPLYSHNPRC